VPGQVLKLEESYSLRLQRRTQGSFDSISLVAMRPKLITLRMTEWGGSECASTHGRFLVAALLGMTRLEGGNDEIDGVEKPTVLGIRNTRRGPSTP
jgi:hypothetical protein